MKPAENIRPGSEFFSRKKAQKAQKEERGESAQFLPSSFLHSLRLLAAKKSAVSCAAANGSVLVVVLVVCLGLVSLSLVLGHSMLMAYRGADNELAGRQADAATLGAVQYAESLMASTTNPGDVPDPTTYQCAAVPVGDGQFWFIGTPGDASTTGTANAVDQPTFGLVDEASKLNLNRATFDMIRLLPNMTDDLAQAIVTWRTAPNPNATPATTGSSASTGVTISSGSVKQGFMESVDEVGLVIGSTDNTLLYGDDVNLNHVLDPEETGTAGNLGNGQYTAGLLEYCTVYSRESNTMSDGTVRVPITNQAKVIQTVDKVLGAGKGESVAFSVRGRLRDIGLDNPTAWVNSVLEFCVMCNLSATDYEKLAPYLANGTGAYTTGLINVNTASRSVLACVPGIGDDLAVALVNARTQQGTTPDQSDWSWVTKILGYRGCRTAGPWLTNRSYQLSADVAAVGRLGRGYRRTRFVIDTSTGTPQVVYRRDLAFLGWALGSNERTNLQISQGNTQGGGAR